MISKQLRLIIILVAAVAVLIGAYFALQPLLSEPAENKAEFDADGDRLGTSGRPYIYDVIEHDDVAQIFVKNDLDSYTFKMDKVSDSLVLVGGENLSLDAEKLSYLYVCTCNMLAMAKVEDAEDLSVYGLDKGRDGNYFEVTDTSGKVYTVYIGDLLPTGAAYYCKYEDKPFVYVISTLLQDTVLSDRYAYISPLLCAPVPSDGYYDIENLKIVKNGELFVEFEKETEEQRNENSASSSHSMIYPGKYIPTSELDGILNLFVGFTGDRVIDAGLDAEKAEKYGFAEPSYEIIFTYGGNERRVIFGSDTEDGASIYAYNPSHDTIIIVPEDTVYFLDWDLIRFVNSSIFQMKIDSIDTMRIKSKDFDRTFRLTGEGKDLVVTDTTEGKAVDTYSFRQFYIDVLMTTIEDYAELPENPEETAAFYVTTRSGESYEYVFYDLTTRRCFFTVNGKGEFCVNRDNIVKMLDNIRKVVNGETFKSEVLN